MESIKLKFLMVKAKITINNSVEAEGPSNTSKERPGLWFLSFSRSFWNDHLHSLATSSRSVWTRGLFADKIALITLNNIVPIKTNSTWLPLGNEQLSFW